MRNTLSVSRSAVTPSPGRISVKSPSRRSSGFFSRGGSGAWEAPRRAWVETALRAEVVEEDGVPPHHEEIERRKAIEPVAGDGVPPRREDARHVRGGFRIPVPSRRDGGTEMLVGECRDDLRGP